MSLREFLAHSDTDMRTATYVSSQSKRTYHGEEVLLFVVVTRGVVATVADEHEVPRQLTPPVCCLLLHKPCPVEVQKVIVNCIICDGRICCIDVHSV